MILSVLVHCIKFQEEPTSPAKPIGPRRFLTSSQNSEARILNPLFALKARRKVASKALAFFFSSFPPSSFRAAEVVFIRRSETGRLAQRSDLEISSVPVTQFLFLFLFFSEEQNSRCFKRSSGYREGNCHRTAAWSSKRSDNRGRVNT